MRLPDRLRTMIEAVLPWYAPAEVNARVTAAEREHRRAIEVRLRAQDVIARVARKYAEAEREVRERR